jgi:hypothetical protein
MRQVTYWAGNFSQVALEEGGKYFVATGPNYLRVDKMWWLFPTGTIWKYVFPFYIRTNHTSEWDTAKEILDQSLTHLAPCRTDQQLAAALEDLIGVFDRYVIDNFEEAMDYAISKVGYEWAVEAEDYWKKPKIWKNQK